MALNKTSMKNRIRANIQARNTNLNAANIAILDPYLEDICDGIIEEIKANLEVKSTVPFITTGTQTATAQQTEVK
jgi:hypothetical protein